jgi:uncharacterized protein (DUF1800 family)
MTVSWNAENAAHLLRRTGFGTTSAQVAQAVKAGMEKTVSRILKPAKCNDKLPKGLESFEDLQAWWVDLMLQSKSPFLERMVLFWHNHFATGFSKVGDVGTMHRQNQIFRRNALGSFRSMLNDVSKDPAMLIWLDNNTNVKGKQNQNFARELMELFTTGVLDKDGNPNYTETDVDESARAFTGWTVKDGAYFFAETNHDFGSKTFKGHTGNFDGVDIIEFLVVDPATARRIPQLLFGYFGCDISLGDPLISELAQIYLDHDTKLAPVLYRLFTSDEFYSDASKDAGVKEPAVFLLSALRPLKTRLQPYYYDKDQKKNISTTYVLADQLDALGQSLFDPPTVFGWDYGLPWVAPAGVLQRAKTADWISEARDKNGILQFKAETILGPAYKKLDATTGAIRILQNFGIANPAPSTVTALANYLAADDVGNPVMIQWDSATIDKKVRGAIFLAIASVEFQRQ